MKFLIAIATLLGATSLQAQVVSTDMESIDANTVGLGVAVGDGTMATLKYFPVEDNAIQVDAGTKFGTETFWLDASYLLHFSGVLSQSEGFLNEMSPYFGAGAGVGQNRVIGDTFASTDWFLRVPLGVAWMPRRYTIDVFAQVNPSIRVAPSTVSYVDGALGARYYF